MILITKNLSYLNEVRARKVKVIGMKVALIGLGKLGLPVSVAMVNHGKHIVYGYDTDPTKREMYRKELVGIRVLISYLVPYWYGRKRVRR